jgi:hypothetical protein
MTASSKAVGVRGSDGMVSRFESLINAVTYNRLKLLVSLNQNGVQSVNRLVASVTRTKCCRRTGGA